MPVEGHDLYCRDACCAGAQERRREQRLLASMTFHERKAYRIAKRAGATDGMR